MGWTVTPSTSWEAAAPVLERAQRLEVRERVSRQDAHCVADFEGSHRTVEGRGDSLREALLRAFVTSRFGDTVDEMLPQSQGLAGLRVEPISERVWTFSAEENPNPDGQVGDIQSEPR